jgi:hypothetical protein
VEEIIREPVELTESELDVVAGGFGSAAAASGGVEASAATTAGGGNSFAIGSSAFFGLTNAAAGAF